MTDIQEPRRRGNPNWIKRAPTAEAMRPVSEDRARAAERARQIREHRGESPSEDKFFIDKHIIPDGWSYEWKVKEVVGKENPHYQVQLKRYGWEAVPASRHPEFMPMGWDGSIERDGLILCERPLELTEEARYQEKVNARDAVRAKEEQLGMAPKGHFTRDNREVRPRINKSYEPMSIPTGDEYLDG